MGLEFVSIHCFPNGNGRHSRLMADIIAKHIFKTSAFNWGALDSRKKTMVVSHTSMGSTPQTKTISLSLLLSPDPK